MSEALPAHHLTADRLDELDWELISYTPYPAHMHMALDEVLLERVIAGARGPTVRFWEWSEPALVIGCVRTYTPPSRS